MTNPAMASIPDDFDLDRWIDGTCALVRTAKVYQRGDLIAKLDELKQEFEIAKKIPKEQRSVADKAPDVLADEWEALAEQVSKSAMTFHVQDRTEERRRKIRDELKKKGLNPDDDDDIETIILHQIADAIVKVEVGGKARDYPDGFPHEKLRAIKDRVGDSGLMPVRDAFLKVISEAPTVSAPLSRNSSSGRGGVI
jgi:hypothetical protein